MAAIMLTPADVSSPDPIEGLFRDRYREFVALATVITRDVSVAEEVVQDAFASTISRSGGIDDPAKLGGYVAQAVANGARGRLRRRSIESRPRRFDPSLAPEPVAPEGGDRSAAFFEAVLRLPQRQAQCVVCRYGLDMTFADIAETLGISQPTAKTHVRRGTAQLAIWLKEHP